MGMFGWFPLCPLELKPVDPSFTPFLCFWPCIAVIAVKRKPMHWNIPLLVLHVTTIGSDAPVRHNFFFARPQHSFRTWFPQKWRKWVLVWFLKLRHARWLEPCPAKLVSEPNTALFWRDFWNFNRPQKKEYLTKSIYFFAEQLNLHGYFN